MGAVIQKAPALKQIGREKWEQSSSGRLIVDNEIVYTIYKATGAKSKTQFGLMMFLLGCAQDGRFSIPVKTVEDRMGIKEGTYYKVLNELVELGLLDWKKGSDIVIRYDNIWNLRSGYATSVELKKNLSGNLEATDSTSVKYSTCVESVVTSDSTSEESTCVESLDATDSTSGKFDDWAKGF